MPSLSIRFRTAATASSRPEALTNPSRSVTKPAPSTRSSRLILRPRIGRMRDGVEVTRREAFEAERVQQARMLAHEHLRDLASDADHLVAVIRVEDAVDIRLDVVEHREVVDGEGADAARASLLVQRAAAFEAAHRM